MLQVRHIIAPAGPGVMVAVSPAVCDLLEHRGLLPFGGGAVKTIEHCLPAGNTGVCRMVVRKAALGGIPVLGREVRGVPVSQALIGGTNESILAFLIGEALAAEAFLADQFRFLVADLLAMEGVVFDIVAQLMDVEISVVLFAAVPGIRRDILG